jgi:uncharacterized protein
MKNNSILAAEFIEKGVLKSLSIIDIHTHMGGFYGSSLPNAKLEDMLRTMDRTNISVIVSAPHAALFDPLVGNLEIENL